MLFVRVLCPFRLQQLVDELGGAAYPELLFSQLRIGQVVDTGVALREHDLSAHLFRLLESAPGHGKRILRKCASDASACAATKGIDPVVRKLHKTRSDLSNRLSGLLIDVAVSTEIARIMVSHLLAGLHTQIKIFKKLRDMDDLNSLVFEFLVLGLIVEGP